jgi:propanediol dehydratase small subunit
MVTLAIVITLFLIAAIYWFARNGVSLPKLFRSRSCQGAGWRHAFPNTSKEDIRLFLSVFVEAFSFHERQRLKFSPSDNIFGIYRARNPYEWQSDGCELETLEASIEKKYGIRLREIWSESLTLGELFARAHGLSHNNQ